VAESGYVVCDLKLCEVCGRNFIRISGDQSADCPRCRRPAPAIQPPGREDIKKQRLTLHAELVSRLHAADRYGDYELDLANQIEQLDQRIKIARC
jgi:hypothetical protein